MSNVLVVIGSPQKSSSTGQVADIVSKILTKLKTDFDVWDLSKDKLPFFTYDEKNNEQVKKWTEKVVSAKGILFISPEYHGFIPGILKNAIDFLDDLDNKVVALITLSNGQGGAFAHNALMQIARNLHAWIVPNHVIVQNVGKEPIDEKRIEILCTKLIYGIERLCPSR